MLKQRGERDCARWLYNRFQATPLQFHGVDYGLVLDSDYGIDAFAHYGVVELTETGQQAVGDRVRILLKQTSAEAGAMQIAPTGLPAAVISDNTRATSG